MSKLQDKCYDLPHKKKNVSFLTKKFVTFQKYDLAQNKLFVVKTVATVDT